MKRKAPAGASGEGKTNNFFIRTFFYKKIKPENISKLMNMLGCVCLNLFRKKKFFRLFLKNLEYCKVNKTRFVLLEKCSHVIVASYWI